MIKILKNFGNGMRLFRWDQAKRMEQAEHGALVRQKKAMNHIPTVLSWTAPDVSSSQTLVSRHPIVRSTASTSSKDVIVHQNSRRRRRTLRSSSRPLFQYRESQIPSIPNKRTKAVQVRELSRKAPLPTPEGLGPKSNTNFEQCLSQNLILMQLEMSSNWSSTERIEE